MRTFKDNADREWSIAVNVETVKRVRDSLDFDLLDVFGGKTLERLVGDPVQLVDVVYVLCQKEAENRGVTSGEFGEAMAGDAIDAATKALLEELVDFFPSQSVRESLQTILHATDRLQVKGAAALKSRLTEEELDNQVQKALEDVDHPLLTAKGAVTSKARATEEELDKIMQKAVELPTSAGD